METPSNWRTFMTFALRVIVAHTLTYFIYGIIMSSIFDYDAIFALPIIRDYMLQIGERNTFLHLSMQPVRGLIFAVALWPIRDVLIERRQGWLVLWGLLLSLGILSTPAAAPSSIEGIIYTRLPLWYHVMGFPEIALQTLFFSIWVVWWERQSVKSRAAEPGKQNHLVAEIVRAIMAACLAYMGYAIGGLLLVAVARPDVDVRATGTDIKMQLMFVAAFIVNTITIFWIARRRQVYPWALWSVFLLFWLIDAVVPWLYQTVVFGGSHIPSVIVLGFFPAAIMAASMWVSSGRNRRAPSGQVT